MPFIQARAKFTNGDGRVVTDASNNLNVNKIIPLNEWMIRVEWCPVGSTVITNRANYELAESIRIPHNAYVNVYPILRSEKDLTQTEYGLHLASFRFDDALINGRSIKTIGTNEIVGTWKFAPRNSLNILSLYTNAEPYGSSALNVIFKQFYGSDIACTIVRETVSGNTTVFHKNVQWGPPNQAQWRVESYVYFGDFVINGVTLNFTAYGWNAFNLQNYINISATTYEQAIAGINYIKQFNAGIMRLNIDGVITDFEFNPKLIDRSYPSGDDRYYRAYITNINVWNFTTDKHGKSGVTTLSLLPSKVVINGGQVKTEYSEWVNSGTIRSGILGIGPVVYAGVNYQNYYSVFTLSSTILYFVPTSPARSESENYNKIRLTITYSATRKLVMEFNYYRIWNNNRQYQWTGGNNLAFDALMRQYIDEVGELKLEFYN